MEELVIASSPVDAGVGCWSLPSGAEKLRYGPCAAPRHGLLPVGGGGARFLLSLFGSFLSICFALKQPQVATKSFPAEPIGPLVSNSEGAYIIGGGSSGAIYLWEVASGKLLNKWNAHLRAVTCLTLSDDESLLISGSEDGSIRVWSLMKMFDSMAAAESGRLYIYSFSEHIFPVTDIVSGHGLCNSIVVSSSMDKTCKFNEHLIKPTWFVLSCYISCFPYYSDHIYTYISYGCCMHYRSGVYQRGRILRSISFPAIIDAIVIDSAERTFYAGGRDSKIYIAALNVESNPHSSYGEYIIGTVNTDSKGITSMALSVDGTTLVFGSNDGTVRVWDIRRKEATRVLKHAKGPVNNVLIVREPLHSVPPALSKRGSWLLPHSLSKYTDSTDGEVDTKAVIGHQRLCNDLLDSKYLSSQVLMSQIKELQNSSGAAELELERIKREREKLTQAVQQWKKLYQDLQNIVVDDLLSEP
ncbi:Protein ROOT INITIATION DEFECTIVE 3 [Ananas comosus]|uniref:Protein ROOT INITIATION DEFECTIVE 3 n=1 Tax=Ananas comosus TaxID=4615 RepID=A0A199UI99_ANACO|nr:Protein ROOT INITIATION DEFECTIVE 3 [Ananas comosus]